jgi:ferrous iron transport protein B
MELPPYKRPLLRVVVRHMWERSKLFLTRAGTVILGINIVLWFLATYPRSYEVAHTFDSKREALVKASFPNISTKSNGRRLDAEKLRADIEKLAESNDAATNVIAGLETIDREEAGEQLRTSFAGRMGHAIEPVIAPLGFDWKMGIGIIGSFAAREVFVSTMSTVYNVGNDDTKTADLALTLREQKHPDGTPVYTALVAVTLMVFYVFALQCVSTVAVVRRETNSWKWPVIQWLYMGALAWGFAFATYRVGQLLGWG